MKAKDLRNVDRAALISDLHLHPGDPAGIDVFVRFARKLPGAVDELFILGDLFDAYVGTKHLKIDGYSPIVRALDSLMGNGVRVTLLKGNRDFLLDAGFTKATGAGVAGDEDAFMSGGKRFLVVHGDLFCINDIRYQSMRKKLRSPVIAAMSRTLPLPILLGIASRLRKTSAQEIATKTPAEMGIVNDEVSKRLAEGFDAVVCGHVHDPKTVNLQNGTLVVLPAWPAAPGTLWLKKGAMEFAGPA
ncbi:MAG: UDP-2,3-diacylglucosamine diphosphatase [Planctomycetota bacterium]